MTWIKVRTAKFSRLWPLQKISMRRAIVVIALIICFLVLYRVFHEDTTHKFISKQLLWQSVPTENSCGKRDSSVSPTSASSGAIFLGERTREFPHSAVRFESFELHGAGQDRRGREEGPGPRCDKWGVVTTIFDVSEAVRKQVPHIPLNAT